MTSREGRGNKSEERNVRTEGHRAAGTNPKAGNLGQYKRTLIGVGNSYLSLSSEDEVQDHSECQMPNEKDFELARKAKVQRKRFKAQEPK